MLLLLFDKMVEEEEEEDGRLECTAVSVAPHVRTPNFRSRLALTGERSDLEGERLFLWHRQKWKTEFGPTVTIARSLPTSG
ncbi:unnamed protein product [Schistocephalus solidus]|uniref:Uncharacterized protein n=1 Tax=Schistocephalus solidus TaxID=70667 RepID=A0A183SLP1_SCHSO|nr:unnamed protein product [Schistocephalus solidus]